MELMESETTGWHLHRATCYSGEVSWLCFCCDKIIPDKSHLGEKELTSYRSQSIATGKSQHQELESSGHVASIVKKKEI